MNIYSIEEIVKATNNFLEPEIKSTIKKTINKKKEKLLSNNENIINETEIVHFEKKDKYQKVEIPFKLENKISVNNIINSSNYQISIKPEIKDKMINELYLYLRKKIKKNTLKLIIEEQLEIKNLKNKTNILKQNINKLNNDYRVLKDNYNLSLKNNEILKIKNNLLQNNLNQVTQIEKQLNIENNELKINLKEIKLNQDDILEKNRYFEIHNSEIKKTISRYIINNKKLQEQINLLENSKNSKSEEEANKVKFYQDENVRLSSDLLSVQKNNQVIKENLNNIKTEKEIIASKIEELNKSIGLKSNIVSSSFDQKNQNNIKNEINKLNDKEQKSLDEVVNKIFSKI